MRNRPNLLGEAQTLFNCHGRSRIVAWRPSHRPYRYRFLTVWVLFVNKLAASLFTPSVCVPSDVR